MIDLLFENDDSRRPHWLRRGLPAVAVALLVNGVLVAVLAAMNYLALPEARAEPPVAVRVQLQRIAEPTAPPTPQPQPDTPTEPIEVDLETPQPPTPTAQPLALDLEIPVASMSPVQVAVRSVPTRPTSPSEPTQQTGRQSPPAETGPSRPQRVDRLPRQIAGRPPSYPSWELRREIEGEVEMEILIDEQGRG
ncbi:MAG: hypothetical protein R3336_08975, partial [Phycisphaeraceae bacterium]|nr:hypothetical protein [Phycisphaeraceae bacterium]